MKNFQVLQVDRKNKRVRRNFRVTRRGRMIASKASHTTTKKTATPAANSPGYGITLVIHVVGQRPKRRGQDSRRALTEISALKSFETGQPVSAAFTAASNLALSAPGTRATRSRWLLVMPKPSGSFSSEIVAVVFKPLAVIAAVASWSEKALLEKT